MKYIFLIFCLFCIFDFAKLQSQELVWKGDVNADGTPTKSVKLILGQTYQIKVSGVINLGKWRQNGQPLVQDANYEFNTQVSPSAFPAIKNSMNIPIGDNKFHSDHVYLSEPFLAIQSGIHFWIYDENYEDNSGSLLVELMLLNPKK